MRLFKIVIIPVLLAAAALIVWYAPFYKKCEAVRENTLRLHVVANSDSERDQAMKLLVRDEILDRFGDSENIGDAVQNANDRLYEIVSVADGVLAEEGYAATARVCTMFFKQTEYGGITMPAGFYTAVRVELGKAVGKNWWCVMYPRLCLMSAADAESSAQEAYGEDTAGVLICGERYEVRFRLEELFQTIKSWFVREDMDYKTDTTTSGDC